jgi:ribonuclease J
LTEELIAKDTTVVAEKKVQRPPRRRTRKVKKQDTTVNAEIKLPEAGKTGKLKIIPLGGLEEVGKNMTVFEFNNTMILIDCGIAFPEDEMLGVDLVIPDITYLEKNKDKLKAIVITHGHEDHIGSIPYVLKQLNVPIYATRLTLGIIKNKLEEHKMVRETKMKCVKAGDIITIGDFKVEFIRATHSIADSVSLAIHTPVGVIIHTGDFKVDYTPIDGKQMDFARLAALGEKGVLALMSDSTNSERPGYTMSESSVGEVFDDIFLNCDKRIIVATFASNVHRVQQIINSAIKVDRKVAICGRSMLNVMTVAKELGYLDIPDGVLVDIEEIDNYVPEKMVLITTGSQGEPMSALSRMAAGNHRKVVISNQDLVIISASPIPGNEKLVSNIIDDLFKIGADVIYHSLADVHVSGHACAEEQKLMLSLVKPKFFIPVHGEFRHLKAHAETAKKVGIPEENIVMMTNGKVLELDSDSYKITGTVQSGSVLIDGLGVGDVGNIVLRDRQHLSQDGLIVIVITMDSKTNHVIAGPDIISRGFVYVRESENLMEEIRQIIKRDLSKCEEKKTTDWTTIKNTLKDGLKDFLYEKTKRNPMIIPIITEV